MPVLDSVNYLVVYSNGDLTLWRDNLSDGTITCSLYDPGREPMMNMPATLRHMLDGIHLSGTRLYVWEDWSN